MPSFKSMLGSLKDKSNQTTRDSPYGPPPNQQASSSSGTQQQQHYSYQPPAGPPPPNQYYQQGQQQQQPPAGFYLPPSYPPPPSSGGQEQFYKPPSNPPPSAPGQYLPPAGPPPATAEAPKEDPFSALKRYDTVFIVDDSESMEMFWDETRDALIGCVQKCVQYDEDGIDVYFFNSREYLIGSKTPEQVKDLFRRVLPRRSTPTATALKTVIDPYVSKVEASKNSGGEKVKPLSILVLTDGAPDRNQEPDNVIIDAAKRLDAVKAPLNQLGIQFLQVGPCDEAAESLRKLDDDLRTKHGIRDIVDTTMWPKGENVTPDTLLKTLQGGWHRKLDKQEGRIRC